MHDKLENSLGFKISQTANRLNYQFVQLLSQYEIAPEQRATLEIISKDNEVSQTKIASILGKNKTTICRSLNSLEKKGLIIRDCQIKDKRVNIIKLTQKGKDVLQASQTCVSEFRKRINSNLEEKEINKLFELLNKVSNTIKEDFWENQ